MWTLQRPNKDPDKKWRNNKESKFSSLLRPGHKKNKENDSRDTIINYRTVDRLHDRVSDRFIDPREDPRLLVDPRGVDPRMMNLLDPRVQDPRLDARLMELDQEVERVEQKSESRVVEAEFKSRVEPDFKSRMEPDFKGRMEPDFKGRMEPDFKGRMEADFKGRMEPDFKGRIEPDFKGRMEPDFKGRMEPDFKGRIEPDFKGRMEPDFKGRTEPDFKVRMEPDFKGRMEPDFKGRMEPDFKGRMEPDFKGRMEPDFKGRMEPDFKPRMEPDPKSRIDAETKPPRTESRLETPTRDGRQRDPSRERGAHLRERLERLEARMGRREPEGRDRYVERYVEQVVRDKEQESCGPAPTVEMVSRRKILGRSQDNLNVDLPYQEEEEDAWYKVDKLFKDHIQEVLMKWEQIDDEIWSKVIVLERNRRVAKAYARAPVLTVNGSDDGFDGYRIGLCGFENPMRDPRTEEIRRHIGHGVKVKMDDQGNILIKRVSKAGVYVKMGSDDNAISNEILKLPNCGLETEKPVMLFDMNKFQQNVKREMRRQYPDRSKLETQCVCVIAFVKNEPDLLDCPIWVMIINIVAMDMLKSKLPPVKVTPNIRNRPRIPLPDEDPYSVAGSGASSGSSGKDRSGKDKPPKLPPRDSPNYPNPVPRPNGKSEYDALDENAFRKLHSRNNNNNKTKDRKYDDPYYCGLRARIPNFAMTKSKDKQEPGRVQYPNGPPIPAHPMWHTRSFDSGMALLQQNHVQNIHRLERNPCSWVPSIPVRNDSDFTESAYSHIYGRLPLPNRGYLPPPLPHPRSMYVGEWD